MTDKKGFWIEVSGDYACFTRPEMKVERVSYDVITPSAARAIFSAILWKPAIEWQITEIRVLKPVKWLAIKRNEVDIKGGKKYKDGFFIDKHRQQRSGLILKDVRYQIGANLKLIDKEQDFTKFVAMFNRRMEKGQCHHQPYLGCREFSAKFTTLTSDVQPIGETRDLGFMLHDMEYIDKNNINPIFFRAKMESGIIKVPSLDNNNEVYK